MVFSTPMFLFYFLPVVLAGYYGLPWLFRCRGASDAGLPLRNRWLLALSYVFYGWWDPWFILLMLAVTAVNYAGGRVMSRPGAGPRLRRWAVTAAVVISLGTLGFFKYLPFLQANLNQVGAWFGAEAVRVWRIVLPVGISFYVFQALSYSLDVYRRAAPPARSFADFACYIALFPQLVAGPIVRYQSVAGQLVARTHTREKFAAGVALFVLGLAKKLLLANPLGAVADAAFDAQALTAGDAWYGAAAYAFQIYFDFAGYSDMAIGLGRMVGFEFDLNFDAPYRAASITEFWRRWHISLSTFLRDYLYIPLGGNRRGTARTYVNLALVMLLGGLWHGANWTFAAWGAYHGLLLAFERGRGRRGLYERLPAALRIVFTFALVLVSWVLFRSENLAAAGRYLGAMLGGGGAGPAAASAALTAGELYGRGPLACMMLAAVLVFQRRQAREWAARLTGPRALVLALVFGVAVAAMFTQTFNPFLYFRF